MRLTSAKISSTIINRIINDTSISSKEIDVLLWISLRQNQFGLVSNVKYYDICNDINISNQEFYNSIYNLVAYKYITVISRSRKYGWDIKILNNIFLDENDDKQRYLTINRKFLYEESFLRLRSNEKKLILKILIEKNPSKKFFLNFETIKKWISIDNSQLIKSYIRSLKKFFNLHISKNNKTKSVTIIINETPLINLDFSDKSQIKYHYLYKVYSICRNMKIKNRSEKNLLDVVILIQQYAKYIPLTSIWNTIINSFEEKNSIEPKYINILLQSRLA